MKIFLDTADIEEIRTVARWGVLDGVTTLREINKVTFVE